MLGLAILGGALAWQLIRSPQSPDAADRATSASASSATPLDRPSLAPATTDPATRAPEWIVSVGSVAPEPAVERSPLADTLHAPDRTARDDVRVVRELLGAFASVFDENPVGDNAEIAAALSGRNREQIAFLPPDHPALDAQGRLLDRWGTPYFFHALGAHAMEVRTAGPDRRLWTEDDVVLDPSNH